MVISRFRQRPVQPEVRHHQECRVLLGQGPRRHGRRTDQEPTRYPVALPAADQYAALSRRLFDLLVDYRERFHCMTFIALYVKGIRSEHLGHGHPDARFCEVLFDIGIEPEGMTEEVLDALVEELDLLI